MQVAGQHACDPRSRERVALAIYFSDRTNTVRAPTLGIIYGYGSVPFISSVVLWPTTSTGCLAVSISLAVLLLVISGSNAEQRPPLLINSVPGYLRARWLLIPPEFHSRVRGIVAWESLIAGRNRSFLAVIKLLSIRDGGYAPRSTHAGRSW